MNRLSPLFETAERTGNVKTEAVAYELAKTLEHRISAEFFIKRDLDPKLLASAFRAARPLPRGMFSSDEVELYERGLDETIRYLVEVATALPKFESAFAAGSLQRLTLISKDVEHVLETVQRIEQQVSLRVDDGKARRYEADYRQAIIRNLDYVELFGADISQESRRQTLSVAYLSLDLQTSSIQSADTPEILNAELVLASLTPEAGRLLVRGEAGSGKSTLFRWIALKAAGLTLEGSHDLSSYSSFRRSLSNSHNWLRAISNKRSSEFAKEIRPAVAAVVASMDLDIDPSWEEILVNTRSLLSSRYRDVSRRVAGVELEAYGVDLGSFFNTEWNWCDRIPFLIRLRDCGSAELPAPQEFPRFVAKELGNAPSDWVTTILKSGRGLLLLDGVDEVPNLHRDRLKREIEAILGAYPENYVLVSTRPAAVPEDWLGDLGFREAKLSPMSDPDKSRFIDKWHQAVSRELERVGKPNSDLSGLAEELKEALAENPPMNRLATNPLLCAMICALHRDRSHKLPESHSELCEALCSVLLHRRERESGLDLGQFPESYRSLQYPQKKAIVQDLAHYMVRNGESSTTIRQAEKTVADALDHFPGRSSSDASQILRGLVERSGLLRDMKPGYIDFIHNTLKEYLAAERFVEGEDVGLLASHTLDAKWQPVILFAAATESRGFATELIQRILKVKNKSVSELRDIKLLSLQARAMALHLDPKLEELLRKIEREMFPPRNMTDAEVLAAGGDAVVRFLKYRRNFGARQAAACVRTLRLIGTELAKQCLLGYLNDRRMTVVVELSQGVNPLKISAVRDIMVSNGRVTIPASVARQIIDLTVLREWPDVVHLNLAGTQISDISALADLTKLQSLDLTGTQISDISALAALKELKDLNLSETQVSDISALAGLTRLQYVNLRETKVTDVSALAALNDLQSLFLSETQISDIAPLARLTRLKYLSLRHTPISDPSPLAGLTALESLFIIGTQISDLSILAGVTGLKKLYFGGNQITNISVLARLTSLEVLYYIGNQISDVSALAGLTRLQILYLVGDKITDISALAGLTGLRMLHLAGTKITDVSALAELTALQQLNLTGTQVSDVSCLARLKGLNIIGP